MSGTAYSGKSNWIHKALPPESNILYLGTADPMEPAFAFRLKALKAERPPGWTTIDSMESLTSYILNNYKNYDAVVVDSMSQWLAAEMIRLAPGLTVEELYFRVHDLYLKFIREVLGSPMARKKLVLVTSDVSGGIAPQEATARIFRQSVAEMNLSLANECEKVLKIELGIARTLK